MKQGLHWWYSGSDSTLPVLGAQIPSLVRELRSQVPCGIPLGQEKHLKEELVFVKKGNKTDIPGLGFFKNVIKWLLVSQ